MARPSTRAAHAEEPHPQAESRRLALGMVRRAREQINPPSARIRVAALIVAAGSGQRMGIDKIFMPLLGKPVILHTLDAFENAPSIDSITIVASRGRVGDMRNLLNGERYSTPINVTVGGATRQDSVFNGLAHLGECEYALVHDGARACVTVQLIERVAVATVQHGAAFPGLQPSDTILTINSNGAVQRALDRDHLVAAQTPQGARFDWLLHAHHDNPGVAVTDEISLLKVMGHPARAIEGDPDNLKITMPRDITRAEEILRERGVRPRE
jgi:2-C-methyl-D-erythritol 4-phosphate cytidylyltransferase